MHAKRAGQNFSDIPEWPLCRILWFVKSSLKTGFSESRRTLVNFSTTRLGLTAYEFGPSTGIFPMWIFRFDFNIPYTKTFPYTHAHIHWKSFVTIVDRFSFPEPPKKSNLILPYRFSAIVVRVHTTQFLYVLYLKNHRISSTSNTHAWTRTYGSLVFWSSSRVRPITPILLPRHVLGIYLWYFVMAMNITLARAHRVLPS